MLWVEDGIHPAVDGQFKAIGQKVSDTLPEAQVNQFPCSTTIEVGSRQVYV